MFWPSNYSPNWFCVGNLYIDYFSMAEKLKGLPPSTIQLFKVSNLLYYSFISGWIYYWFLMSLTVHAWPYRRRASWCCLTTWFYKTRLVVMLNYLSWLKTLQLLRSLGLSLSLLRCVVFTSMVCGYLYSSPLKNLAMVGLGFVWYFVETRLSSNLKAIKLMWAMASWRVLPTSFACILLLAVLCVWSFPILFVSIPHRHKCVYITFCTFVNSVIFYL